LLKRDIDEELAMYDVEESSAINALIIIILLQHMPKCTLSQLACASYLVRFTNVLSKLLNNQTKVDFLKGIPYWEFGNLDTVLSPYIIQKFDTRFLRGIKELLAKNLIHIDKNNVSLACPPKIELGNDDFKHIQHKAYYASLVVMNKNNSELVEQIYRIVGEEQWQNLYLSTASH